MSDRLPHENPQHAYACVYCHVPWSLVDHSHECPARLRAEVERLAWERDEAQISAADVLEILGETAWGVQLPALFVHGPVVRPDGTIGTDPVPTALSPGSAKQLVEHVYQRLKDGRGWLRQARLERDDARREVEALREVLLRVRWLVSGGYADADRARLEAVLTSMPEKRES
jgi:hypothetical protein